MSLPVTEILKAYGFKVFPADENNVKCLCPFHKDSGRPNCHVELDTGAFNCFACKAGSKEIFKLLAQKANKTEKVVRQDLEVKFGVSNDKIVDVALVERYYRKLQKTPKLIAKLIHRGVTPGLITYYKLGADKDRITIPVKNASAYYVNIRRYNPGATVHKFTSLKGRGENRFYPIEQLHFNTVLYTGGEIKAIVAAYHLNTYGVGSLSGTAGEASLSIKMAELLSGKTVYVCMDVDDAGVLAANKVANILIRYCKKVLITTLPLDKEKYPKGDINDYVREYSSDKKSFFWDMVQANSVQYKLAVVKPHESNGEVATKTSLFDSVEGKLVGKRIAISGRVMAVMDKPFEIPKTMKVTCDKSEVFCSFCPIFHETDIGKEYTIPNESKSILSMCDEHEAVQQIELKAAVGIPKKCKVCSFSVTEYYSVQEARISNILSMTERDNVAGVQTAFCLGNSLEANCEYKFTGRNFPRQTDQSATFIFSGYEPLEDELLLFKGKRVAELSLFSPKHWTVESISEKLADIYADLTANVTHIYERDRMHLAVDLSYHSPLQFNLDKKLQKGWVEVLIVGDSSIGKTETVTHLRNHYGVGKRTSCKGTTAAGLLGGLQKISGRFFITWGVIPLYDKQLVILEELSGAKSDAIQGITDMRSTGIAEISKIEKRSTHARTRLIAISNPVVGKSLSSYTFGIQAIQELIRAPEDIRRFDLCLVESHGDIGIDRLTELQAYRPQVTHKYTSVLCRELVLWGWSREIDQVQFEPEAIEALKPATSSLCNQFSESCPIIDKGSTRYKLARLAAALAVRTFSNADKDTILVRKCHVEYIHNFLTETYKGKAIGYHRYSEQYKYVHDLQGEDTIKVFFDRCPAPTRELVSKLLYALDLDIHDMADWTGFDPQGAREVLSLLVRKNALVRGQRQSYRKTEAFNSFLHDWYHEGDMK